MGILAQKFSTEEFTGQDIASLPNRPGDAGITAKQLKERFDQVGKMMVALGKHNGLVDALSATTAAGEIGASVPGMEEGTVGAVLDTFKTNLDDRYTKAESNAIEAGNDASIQSISLQDGTGVFTFTRKDGRSFTIDTAVEKIPIKVYLDGTDFVLELEDGSVQRVSLADLVDVYAFLDSGEVDFTVTGAGREKSVTATLKNGSITMEKLSLSAVTTIEEYVAAAGNAKAGAEAAKAGAETAEIAAEAARDAAIGAKNTAVTAKNDAAISREVAAQAAADATNAKQTALTAASAAGAARDTATAASTTAEMASMAATTAKTAAETAEKGAKAAKNLTEAARDTTVTAKNTAVSAKDGAVIAQNAAIAAKNAAETAKGAAISAKNDAITAQGVAVTAKTTAEESATRSKSWAIGGTGTRQGENSDNAKYWAGQAMEIVKGDFATKTELANGLSQTLGTAKAYTDAEVGKITTVTIGAETPAGAQTKATTAKVEALASAKAYTDAEVKKISPAGIGAETPAGAQAKADTAKSGAISAANSYTDTRHTAAKAYTDTQVATRATAKRDTAIVPATGWSAAVPYTQNVTVSGLLTTDLPLVGVVYSDNAATREAEREAWGCVTLIESVANGIRLTCDSDKPTVNLNIQVQVTRGGQ